MNIKFPNRRTSFLLMMMALLAACAAAPKVRVDWDSKTNFANYKTFAWVLPKPVATGEAKQSAPAGDTKQPTEAGETKPVDDTLAGGRARASLITALQAKGYTLDEAHPDVRVSVVLNVYQRPKQSGLSIGLGAGGGSGNVAGGVGVSLPVGKRKETVGAMAVNVFDASRNAPVWNGTGEMVVSDNGATEAEVQKLTDTILAKYPVRAH